MADGRCVWGSIGRLYVLAMMISHFEFEYIYTHAYARIEERKADTSLRFSWLDRTQYLCPGA